MIEKFSGKDSVSMAALYNRAFQEEAKLKGVYKFELVRDGRIIEVAEATNIITTEGMRYILDISMHGGNGTTYYAKGVGANQLFYVALVNAPETAEAAGMTYDVPSFTEFTGYDEATRPAWTGVLHGSAASITNAASTADFTISGTSTVWGAALVSDPTKGNHDSFATDHDVLISYSKRALVLNAGAGDTVKVTVTLSLS